MTAEDQLEAFEQSLSQVYPQNELFILDSARRLTGPGLLWSYSGAVLDIFSAQPVDHIASLWQIHAHGLLNQIGWSDQQCIVRRFDGGLNLAISAPMDQLYSAVAVAQLAWYQLLLELDNVVTSISDALLRQLRQIMQAEANPALIALLDAAEKHDIDTLCDDDELSLGHGKGSRCWPVNALPDPDAVPWQDLHDIPVALITGTNGKTTTTRLCFAIARAAGLRAGLTSTDFVRVEDDILDHGDYSGPGGARMLLRDPRVEMACLEVARGGILRRGLPLRRARAALVNNVAADHLGQYGVNTVPELAAAKFSVYRALGNGGTLVLNADDPYVVVQAAQVNVRILWFSLQNKCPQIVAAVNAGDACAWLEDDQLIYFDGKRSRGLIQVRDIPISLDGAARYNIANALGALCLSFAMGLEDEAIVAGLKGFQNDPADNPGRCNEFEVNGARVFVDFAHNPHSIDAVVQAISAMPANKRYLLLSHAGDRSDQDIRDVTASALNLQPDYLVAAELGDYLRGRAPGDVPQRITETAKENGLKQQQILRSDSPAAGAEIILKQLKAGDVALLLVLSERERIFEMIRAYTSSDRS